MGLFLEGFNTIQLSVSKESKYLEGIVVEEDPLHPIVSGVEAGYLLKRCKLPDPAPKMPPTMQGVFGVTPNYITGEKIECIFAVENVYAGESVGEASDPGSKTLYPENSVALTRIFRPGDVIYAAVFIAVDLNWGDPLMSIGHVAGQEGRLGLRDVTTKHTMAICMQPVLMSETAAGFAFARVRIV